MTQSDVDAQLRSELGITENTMPAREFNRTDPATVAKMLQADLEASRVVVPMGPGANVPTDMLRLRK